MKLHNLKEKIYQFLEIQDSSKSQFQFLFQGKRDIHFLFGMILSLLLNIASICLSVSLILELMYHSKPTVNYAKFLSSVTKNMTLNTKELLFTIAIRDQNYNLINDPSIGQIIASYEKTTTINGEFNFEIINLDFMNCSNVYHLFNELGVSDRFNSTGLLNYNCYNYSQPIIIGGKYGIEFYSNLDFNIVKCRNSSKSNIICKSEEEINSIMQNGWLQITYVSSYVDFNNYSNPIQYVTEDSYIYLDISMNKQLFIYFSPLEIYSEKDLIFSNQILEHSTKHDYSLNDIVTVLDDGIISSIMVCPSFTVEKYYRRYIKIQEIGASIGGFYSVLNIFVILISSFHKMKYTEMKIINELFAFGSEKIIQENYSLFKNQKIENLSQYFDKIKKKKTSKNLTLPNKQIKKDKTITYNIPVIQIQDNTKFNRLNYYKIDLGMINSFKLMLCCCSSKMSENYKEYKFVMKELLKYIDYIQVSKYFMDVEKIKTIMKSQNICDKWVSEKKLIIINDNETENETSKIVVDSTVLANSHFLFKDNKSNEITDILKQ